MQRDQLARAVVAVRSHMAARRWSRTDLARAAGLNVDTVADMLSGARAPQDKTRLALDAALGWAPGTFEAVAEGAMPPAAAAVQEGAEVARAAVHAALADLSGEAAVKVIGQVLLDLAGD